MSANNTHDGKNKRKPVPIIKVGSQKFGNLTAFGQREMSPITLWDCTCDCGNRRVVEENRLFEGKVTMCIPCEFKHS